MRHDAFIGHARQRHDLTGCSETRAVGAQNPFPMRLFTLEFANSSSRNGVQFSSCAVNIGIENVPKIIVNNTTN